MRDKNSLIGWLLIGLVFVVFMVYNSKQSQKQAELMRIQQATEAVAKVKSDSIKKENAIKEEKKLEEERTDSNNIFFQARQGKDGITTIKNNLLKLDISNKGGQILRAELLDKTYKSREGGNIVLFDSTDNVSLAMLLDGKAENINTQEFFFNPENATDSSVSMVLPIGEGNITIDYEMVPNSYLVNMDVTVNSLKNFFSSEKKTFTIVWQENMRQQEKSFSFENRYSTITYRDTEGDTDELSSSGQNADDGAEEFENPIKWLAFKTQFFSQILIADGNFKAQRMTSTMGQKGSGHLKELSATVTTDFDPTGKNPTNFKIYLGPNKFQTLKENEAIIGTDANLDLQSIVYLGWPIVRWINRFIFLYMFDFLTSWGLNMGLILLLITLIVKFAVFPLMKKSYLSSANMRVLRPKVDEIAKKYPNKEDAMLKQQETMQLYSQYGVSPMGGCLPMLIQMPIWIALFNFIPNAIELRGQSFLWADDLSTYDDVLQWNGNVWGIGDHLSIFCVLWCITMVANTFISMRQQSYSMTSEQQQSMKFMRWFSYAMPFIFFFSFNDYAAGLNFYYFVSGLISILMMWYLRKSTDDTKLLERLEARYKERKSSPKKASSLMERMQAMAEQQRELQRRQQEERNKRK